MQLPTPKRIRIEDFSEEERELISKLAFAINGSISTLFDLGNKRISFADNIAATIASFQVTVDSDGVPTNPISLTQNSKVANLVVQGVFVIDVLSADGTIPEAGVFVSWSSNKTGITINKIKGLTSNKQFLVKLIMIN